MSVIRNKPNRQTWDRVLAGDVSAYQLVVESHQSAVSAVAYAIIGDFPISQDIAQETFWVAWTERNSLRDVRKLGSWLCGIARNLARQWRKKHKSRDTTTTTGGSLPYEPVAHEPDPAQKTIADEEQKVVWGALEKIPENYREVLTLYYRHGQSIAEVAGSLDITEDSARQRLSRGRTMLRGRVAQLIEGVLVRTKPDASFAAKVIAGLTGAGLAVNAGKATASTVTLAKAAGSTAAGMAAAKGALTTGAAMGLLGGMLGAIGGLGGGYLGTWLPAQLAPTETERQLILQQGRVILGIAILFTIGILGLSLSFAFFGLNPVFFVVGLIAMNLAFAIPIIVLSVRLNKLIKQLRDQINAEDDPNQSRIAGYARKYGVNTVRRGRSYTSDLELFGYPLIDIQFSDADFGGAPLDKSKRKHARGWIAIGDVATGILFACGGIAKGFVAIGGMAVGAVSFGGLSLGIVSMGGLAVGLMWAIGGGAIGYDAMGGGAIGYHSAVGGGAIAWHIASGGFAAASEYAVGGAAFANEANTPIAQQMVEEGSFQYLMQWMIDNQPLFIGGVIAVSILPFFLMRWVYIAEDSGKNTRPPGKHL